MKYDITFNALTADGEVVGTATFQIITPDPMDLKGKPLAFERMCVDFARLIGISCSYAEIAEVKCLVTNQ